jgi:chromate transporter
MNSIVMSGGDWLVFCGHLALLSLLSVGGTITVASDLNRRLVIDHGWLSDTQFAATIALAQAAPGPNMLFVGLVGWQVGLNAGGYLLGSMGLLLSLVSLLLPSSVLALATTRWVRRHRQDRSVRAFKQGMAPLVVGMMLATATVLNLGAGPVLQHLPAWGITLVSALLVWRTRLHLLWLLAAGALLGALGWV